MTKTNGDPFFNDKDAPKKKVEQLSIRDRFLAYGNLPRFFMLVWRTNRWLTLGSCLLRISQAFLPLAMLQVGKVIIDQVVKISHNTSVPQDRLWKFVIIEFSLVLVTSILSRLIALIDDLLAELLTNHTNIMIMAHAAILDLNQFENSAFYDKLERARQQYVDRALLLSALFSQVQDLITMTSYIIVLLAFAPMLILLLLVFILPSIIGSSYFNAKNYLLIKSQTEGRRQLDYLGLIGSSDATAKEVRLFNLATFFIKRYRLISVSLFKAKRRFGIKQSYVGTLLNIPSAVGFYISFVYIIHQVLVGAITLGGLTFFMGCIKSLGSLAQTSARRFKAIAQSAYYLRDFFGFFDIKPKIIVPVNARPFPDPIKIGFTFEDVGFKYTNSNRWANRHLSFTLRPGEKLALVGENGAGKTTLVKLLSRLYDPTEGRILLDGHDLKEYDVNEIRIHIGIIFQDFIRYQMTASDNIAVGNLKEMDNEQLIAESAKQSLADTIIERLPNKYQQVLGLHFNNGFELSGGEWQKVALARAYMRNSQIIILDEPTAALDARSEYEVFQRFSDITNRKTAVLISHRFSTVRMADRIIVLDKGEIIEIGSHEELLEKEGRYAELFQLQALGYR
jgi:ATP-binding cassette, subfamily B, bacterial